MPSFLTAQGTPLGCTRLQLLASAWLVAWMILLSLFAASLSQAADMEVLIGSPMPATLIQGSAESKDSDEDGISDKEEVAAGSAADDPKSFPALTVQSFSALPNRVFQAGEAAILNWSVQGASSVMLSSDADDTQLGPLLAQGVVRVSPQVSTTYTLSAQGPEGAQAAQVQVVVAPAEPKSLWTTQQHPLAEDTDAIGASLAPLKEGAVYLGSFDGNYYRFSANGVLEWTLENFGVVMNPAVVVDDVAFVGTNGGDAAEAGRVVALNADKSIRWEVTTPTAVISGPVLNADNSIVYAASYGGLILGLNTADGKEVWRYQLPDGATVSAAPTLSADGKVLYVHSTDHKLFAVAATKPARGGSIQVPIFTEDDTLVFIPVKMSSRGPALLWQRDLQSKNEQPVDDG